MDIFGVNGIKKDFLNVFKYLVRCFLVIVFGFYCIVLVIFGLERLNDDDIKMVIDLDMMLGKSVYSFIIIVFIGVVLCNFEDLIDISKDICKFCIICGNNYLSLGDNIDEIIIV